MNTEIGKVVRIEEVARIDGKPAVRFAGCPPGRWKIAKSEIDAIIEHVQREIPGLSRTELFEAIGVAWASITWCRQGELPIQDAWLLRIQDYTGIHVSELRAVACIESETVPHFKARKG